jgi:biotin transport system substrate-specific component
MFAMDNQSYAVSFRPQLKKEALLYDFVLIIGASIFIAVSAQIAFNVPFSPVPVTGQTFAVILTGALLGSRRGSLAVITYLFEGISGLPVFAHAQFGLIHLFGPTGGYLIGFIPAAFICGFLVENGWGKTFLSSTGIMFVGTIVIFISGLTWLKIFVGNENIWVMGFYPYLTGAVIKIVLAASIYRLSWQVIDKYSKNEAEH